MSYTTRLTGLRPLYKSMTNRERPFEHFQVAYAGRHFDCLFAIDADPFELVIGMVGSRWGTLVKVNKGFIASMEDNDFYALCDILELTPKGGVFTSPMFLAHIANSSPCGVGPHLVPPHVLVRIDPKRIKNIPESDKIFFKRWAPQGKKQAHNFDKTQRLIGKKAADFCRKHNISSCWSDNPAEAKPVKILWE